MPLSQDVSNVLNGVNNWLNIIQRTEDTFRRVDHRIFDGTNRRPVRPEEQQRIVNDVQSFQTGATQFVDLMYRFAMLNINTRTANGDPTAQQFAQIQQQGANQDYATLRNNINSAANIARQARSNEAARDRFFDEIGRTFTDPQIAGTAFYNLWMLLSPEQQGYLRSRAPNQLGLVIPQYLSKLDKASNGIAQVDPGQLPSITPQTPSREVSALPPVDENKEGRKFEGLPQQSDSDRGPVATPENLARIAEENRVALLNNSDMIKTAINGSSELRAVLEKNGVEQGAPYSDTIATAQLPPGNEGESRRPVPEDNFYPLLNRPPPTTTASLRDTNDRDTNDPRTPPGENDKLAKASVSPEDQPSQKIGTTKEVTMST